MSDDALAALLRGMIREYRHSTDCGARDLSPGGDYLAHCTCGRDELMLRNFTAQAGVVVLPPAVAEVLRTGEPSEAMLEGAAKTLAWNDGCSWRFLQEGVRGNYKGEADKALRAALAVLREPLDKPPSVG